MTDRGEKKSGSNISWSLAISKVHCVHNYFDGKLELWHDSEFDQSYVGDAQMRIVMKSGQTVLVLSETTILCFKQIISSSRIPVWKWQLCYSTVQCSYGYVYGMFQEA